MLHVSSFQTHTHGNRHLVSGQFLFHERDVQIQMMDSIIRKAKNISEGQQLEVVLLLHHCSSYSRYGMVTFFDELATVQCSKNGATQIIWGFEDDDILELGQLLMERCGLQFQFLNLGITSHPSSKSMAFPKWTDQACA